LAKPRCIWPSCRREGKPARLPLTGEYVSLCDTHRPARTMAHMRSLLAHG